MKNEENDHAIDLSWTNEYNRTINSEDHPLREPLDSIEIQYIYVSKKNKIIEKQTEKYIFENHDSNQTPNNSLYRTISTEQILQLIQTKKTQNEIRYKMTNAVLYLIDLEPNDIIYFAKMDQPTTKSFFQEVSILKPISLPPSIFIFHSINRLYFIFREMTLISKTSPTQTPTQTPTPVSILKKDESKKPSTKKVRISPDAIFEQRTKIKETTHSPPKTAKNRPKITIL
jgi:hypothetical protein